VIGTYGIAVVHADVPDFMIGARRGSPLVLGVGNGENFLASDVSAIVAYTRDAVYLNDFDVVAVGPDKFEISSLAATSTEHPVSKSRFHSRRCRQKGLSHYMLKEIFEQRTRFATRCAGVLTLTNPRQSWRTEHGAPQLRDVGRIVLAMRHCTARRKSRRIFD